MAAKVSQDFATFGSVSAFRPYCLSWLHSAHEICPGPSFHCQTKTAGDLISPAAPSSQFYLWLELVAQFKLHYARVGQQSSVVSEIAAVRHGQAQALHIEPREVQCVEHVPAEHQVV